MVQNGFPKEAKMVQKSMKSLVNKKDAEKDRKKEAPKRFFDGLWGSRSLADVVLAHAG